MLLKETRGEQGDREVLASPIWLDTPAVNVHVARSYI